MIFNTEKTLEEYSNTKLFGNVMESDSVALLDTINKKFDDIWANYKEMKALDWDENEFDYRQCLTDFEKVHPDTAEMMINTIFWQWEADSVASQCPAVLIAPYKPCTELWEAELRINDNESVHANTYSEIVRMSFKKPDEVLKSMMEKLNVHRRLNVIGESLKDLQKRSQALAYFGAEALGYTDYHITRDMMEFYFTMFVLERVQFMASFAVTFTICRSNVFQPIGNAVKKICQDELEVHAEYRLNVIKHLLNSKHGKQVYELLKPKFEQMVEEVFASEFAFIDYVLDHDRKSVVGTNTDLLKKWVLFNGRPVVTALNLDINDKYVLPETNPMPHLDKWIDINKTQTANQETNNTQYKVNVVRDNDDNVIYTF